VLKRFVESLKIQNLACVLMPKATPAQDGFLLKSDRNPNTRGAELLGFPTAGEASQHLLGSAAEKKFDVLIIFHHDLSASFEKENFTNALARVPTVIFIGTNQHATSALAHFVLPVAAWPEKDGTFTNFAERVQRMRQAVPPLGDALPEWMILKKLGRELGAPVPYLEVEDVFNALTHAVSAFAGLSYEALGEQGLKLGEDAKAAMQARKINKVPDKLRIIPIFE
jgi:predicted molibdopterin-dependent oxidoreductase YjgC